MNFLPVSDMVSLTSGWERRVTRDEAVAAIGAQIAQHFETDAPITHQTCAFDIDGWDSLAHFVFIIKLEKAFGFRATDKVRYECDNVGELADAILEIIDSQ